MKCLLIIAVIGLFFFQCSSYDENPLNVPILSDVFTLELTITGEDYPEEYLLAGHLGPMRVIVNNAGDIVINDELRLKVFDSKGKPKNIIGGPGQGPGEFGSGTLGLWISPGGYISVQDNYGVNYNVFKPDYSLLKKFNFRTSDTYNRLAKDYNIKFRMPSIIYLKESERIIEGRNNSPGSNPLTGTGNVLLHEKDNEITILVKYGPKIGARVFTNEFQLYYSGGFHFGVLPGKRVVYSHAAFDLVTDTDVPSYMLHIVSLESMETTTLILPYSRTKFPDSIMNKLESKDKDKLKKAKFFPPFWDMFIDGNYVFLFYGAYYHNGEKSAYVIDLDAGKCVSEVCFPFYPAYIKDGFAYVLTSTSDGFPALEKYKIDPTVYGK